MLNGGGPRWGGGFPTAHGSFPDAAKIKSVPFTAAYLLPVAGRRFDGIDQSSRTLNFPGGGGGGGAEARRQPAAGWLPSSSDKHLQQCHKLEMGRLMNRSGKKTGPGSLKERVSGTLH